MIFFTDITPQWQSFIQPKVNYVICRHDQPVNTDPVIARIMNLLVQNGATTYQDTSVEVDNLEFISPVKRSFKVKMRFKVGGRVAHLPLDEEEIVYFDE